MIFRQSQPTARLWLVIVVTVPVCLDICNEAHRKDGRSNFHSARHRYASYPSIQLLIAGYLQILKRGPAPFSMLIAYLRYSS
jgi:hypothetical protein